MVSSAALAALAGRLVDFLLIVFLRLADSRDPPVALGVALVVYPPPFGCMADCDFDGWFC